MHRKVVLASALALAMGMSDARADEGGVRVVVGGSSALVRRNRLVPWHKLGAAAVPEGYELSCEQDCRVKVDAANSLIFGQGTVISIDGFFNVPLFSRDRLVSARQITLLEGKLAAASSGTRGMPLVISARGSSHVALRAAEAQVAVNGDHVAAQVTSGTARAGANHKWINLESGQMSILPAQGGPSDPVPALAVPEWTTRADCTPGLAIGGSDAPASLGGCWKPVARAVSYVVEVSREASFTKLESVERSTSPSWSQSLSPGRYFVRVRAVDDDGIASADSAPRTLGTIVVKAPLGSNVEASTHTFTVPQGRSLEFPDPAGLEIALDAGTFVPAQRFLVMDDVPSHVLHVRFRTDPGSVGTAVLQRRALAADVTFSPKLARWPQDPVDITVTLSDKSGVVNPAQVSPKMHVLVGLAEVPVEWSHSGRAWAARLAPRNAAPTVIRVIAEDEFGTPIGRNFLEVDQGPGYVANK